MKRVTERLRLVGPLPNSIEDRWRDLFNASFEVLLYDLTSTYFEADPPFLEGDKRRHGYSRDRRPDCVQGASP